MYSFFLSFFLFLLLNKREVHCCIIYEKVKNTDLVLAHRRDFCPEGLIHAVGFRDKPRATKLDDLLSLVHGNSICRNGSPPLRLLVFISMPAMTADDDFDSQTRLPITRGWYPYGS